MKRAFVVVIVLCGACSKGKSKAGGGSAAGSGSPVAAGSGSAPAVPEAKELAPCPTGDALKAKTAQLFAVPTENVDAVECVAGKFPQPAWAIAARYTKASKTEDESGVLDRIALVDASGTIVGSTEEEVPFGAVDSSGTDGYQAIDLDGDKTDELVFTWSTDKRGYMNKMLLVQRLVNKQWESILTRSYEYDNSAAEPEGGVVSCTAAWKIEPAGGDGKRAIAFEPQGKVKKGTSEDDCVTKKETWALGADGKYAKK